MVVSLAYMRGIPVDDRSRDHALPTAGGWRLRWTADGRALSLGQPPQFVADNAEAVAWRPVNPVTGAAAAGDSLATLVWNEGPTLIQSVTLPDTVLARTASGRFILALERNPAAREYEAKQRLVVYEVHR